METDTRVNILLVDDKPDKVLALEAVLEGLGENLVRAYSGREALRHLLQEEFAVILLDVNMPGMDGFETASLIRQRKSTAHVPIIFVTALGDDNHVARGYSLGAVDYIQTPVVPEVLRTKVSVFVDLCRKNEQVRRQASWLRHRAAQMHKLTAASLAISSALSMEKMLSIVTDTARDVIGAHQAFTTMVLGGNWARAQTAVSLSDKYAEWGGSALRADQSGIGAVVCSTGKPIRMAQQELADQAAWHADSADGRRPLPLRGLLAAPLVAREGRNLGLIEVSDKIEGDFTGEDEAILVQLAQLAAIAIENSVYAEERETNRIKDEFLWTLSHELRTPLNAILGWTQLLRMEHSPEDVLHGLEVIERNARVQTKLIEDLLDVSRITTGKMRLNVRPISLGEVIEAAMDALRPAAAAKQIELTSELSGDDRITGDPDRLQQVVWNLLSNAIKFTPPKGRVSVKLANFSSHVELCVTDTGQGISRSFLPYVFDRFRQADSTTTRVHGGLGIGLTIARHIVELHGGMIEADSPGEGKGCTFRVTLRTSMPQPEEQPEAVEPPPVVTDTPTLPSAALAGIHVLLVDDQPDALDVVGSILRRMSARVTAVPSVAQAMEALRTEKFDVLISDIGMPERDGHDLIRHIRALPPEQGGTIPAIALTAYAHEADRLRSLSAGFQLHVCKPVEPNRLVSAVSELAVRRQPQTQNA